MKGENFSEDFFEITLNLCEKRRKNFKELFFIQYIIRANSSRPSNCFALLRLCIIMSLYFMKMPSTLAALTTVLVIYFKSKYIFSAWSISDANSGLLGSIHKGRPALRVEGFVQCGHYADKGIGDSSDVDGHSI